MNYLRKCRYLFYVLLKKIFFEQKCYKKLVVVYSDGESKESIRNQYSSWYFKEIAYEEIKYEDLSELDSNNLYLFLEVKNYFKFALKGNKLKNILTADRNLFLASDATTLASIRNYFNSGYDIKTISKENYQKLLASKKSKKAYCFLTGPTINDYESYEIDKSAFKIACNSIIKDRKLLSYIDGIDVLAFADPVFHFSANAYSKEFRKDLIEVYNEYRPFIVIPSNYAQLLLNNFPFLKPSLIAVNESQLTGKFEFPTVENDLTVKGCPNILTYIMLPLASAVASNIYILGADGRAKGEKYFWRHNEKTQYKAEMDSVFQMHPSFLRDYRIDSYYKQHLLTLENLISFGEERGRHYQSLTPSFISSLESRRLTQ